MKRKASNRTLVSNNLPRRTAHPPVVTHRPARVKSKLKLKRSKAFTFSGTARYTAVYDHAAGRDNVYTLLMGTAASPVVIGRELDLKTCEGLISDYEEEFERNGGIYFGDLETALVILQRVTDRRKKGDKGSAKKDQP